MLHRLCRLRCALDDSNSRVTGLNPVKNMDVGYRGLQFFLNCGVLCRQRTCDYVINVVNVYLDLCISHHLNITF